MKRTLFFLLLLALPVQASISYFNLDSLVFDDDKLVISANGIGIQGAPSHPLHVQGTSLFSGPFTFDLGTSSDVYTVNWGKGNIQIMKVTQSGAVTVEFSNPPAQSARLVLVIQYTATTPGPLTFAQPSGATIQFGNQVTDSEFFPIAASTDVFYFYWDSTAKKYYGRVSSGVK